MNRNKLYIGKTGRNLKKRLVEHKEIVKRGDTKNGIAVHALEQQHRVNWDKASALVQGGEYWKLWRFGDMPRMNTNLDCGLSLNSIWAPYLSL